MFCGKCGFELEEGSLFCGNCGSAVPGGASPAPEHKAVHPEPKMSAKALSDDAADAAAAMDSLDASGDYGRASTPAAAPTVVLEPARSYQDHGYDRPASPDYSGPAAAPTGKGKNTKVIAIASAVAAAAVVFALVWFFTHGGMDLINGGGDDGQNAVAETEMVQDDSTASDATENTFESVSPSQDSSSTQGTDTDVQNADTPTANNKTEAKDDNTSVKQAENKTEDKTDTTTESKSDSKTDSKSDSKTDNQDTAPAASTSADYVLPDSDSRYYSESELKGMSTRDLYVARNEIYARHGRGFKNADLQNYFNSKSWYTKRYEPDEFDKMASTLNDYEQKNADLMLKVETDMNSPYLAKENRPAI